MKIVFQVNTLKNEVEDLKKYLMANVDTRDILNMSPVDFMAVQKALSLVDDSLDLLDEYAKKIDSMDDKLDRILEEVEKKNSEKN